MGNFELQSDEVVLLEDNVNYSESKGTLKLTLTSKKIVLEKETGIFKKELELVDIIYLENIKVFNDKVQVNQKSDVVSVQTNEKNVKITFSGFMSANKFTRTIVNVLTGTTATQRGANKVKDAFNMVDDVLQIDTRGTVKGIVENGITGTLFKGIKKKK